MKLEPKRRAETLEKWGPVALLGTVGLTLGLSVAIGAGLGLLADRWLKTNGIAVIIGAVLGSIAGFRQLFKTVSQALKIAGESDADQERSRQE